MGRPAYRFRGFIGHRAKVEPIVREVRGAKARGIPAGHIMVIGPSGVGKSLLVRELAAEYGTDVVKFIGVVTVKELLDALAKMKPGDFLLLDEAHALPSDVQEILYQLMDSGRILVSGRPEPFQAPAVTVVLSTDKPGALQNALHKRIGTEVHLELYDDRSMKEVVEEVADREDLLLSPQAAAHLAAVANGLPRRAEQLLRKLRLYYPDAEQGQMSVGAITEFLTDLGIDECGFNDRDRRYLRFLRREGPASVATLASVLGVDPAYVERQVEPKIRRQGLVRIGSGGRSLTQAGREWVKQNRSANKKGD